MTKVLVFIQHDQGKILKGSLVAVSAAKQLATAWGADGLVGVALGSGAKAAATEAASYGLTAVRFSENPLFEKYRAEPYARAIAVAARETAASTVVALASSTGKDALPRVAVLLDAAQASDIIGVNQDGTLKTKAWETLLTCGG